MRRKEQMNSENMEIRAFNFEVRAQADEEHGTFVEGTPIVYDSWTNLGWYDEMIDRGALADTDLRDVRFLVNHNTDMIPLARSRNNNENSTMQMSIDDEVGMKIRVNLDTENNAEAKALYSAIERGDISGMSFMFTVDGDRWEDESSEHPKRHIERISKVFEVSAVTFPAYEATNISARGLADVLDNAKASLESVRAEKRAIELLKAKIRILSEV
jgi:HK97 family phage prohead protease